MGHGLGSLLLTGGSGYLGGHVQRLLMGSQTPCTSTSLHGAEGPACDLTRRAEVADLLEAVRPSAIIHCAAGVPKSPSGYDDADIARHNNVMVETLAGIARCPIVFVSSMTVYGEGTTLPADEEDAVAPIGAYARSKTASEQVLRRRDVLGDVALRIPGLFGWPRRSGLLYNAARSFLRGEEFVVSGVTGLWAAMMVDDAAEYVVRAAGSEPAGPFQAVNVGYDDQFDVLSAVARIAALCHVEWHPPASVATPFSMCTKRLKARYGSLEATFDQRLQQFVDIVRIDVRSEPA